MLFITNQLPNFVGTGTIAMSPADPRTIMEALQSGFISLVNDKTTADIVTNLLGVEVNQQTCNIIPKLGEDTVILINIIGAPLPANTKTLPPTHNIQFSVIESRKPMVDVQGIKKSIANWLLK